MGNIAPGKILTKEQKASILASLKITRKAYEQKIEDIDKQIEEVKANG